MIYNVYSKPLDYYQKFEKYNLKTWKKVIETNLTGAFLSCQSAINHFKKKGEIYKAELIESIPKGEELSIYFHGEWHDLCRGQHLSSTGKI